MPRKEKDLITHIKGDMLLFIMSLVERYKGRVITFLSVYIVVRSYD